MKRRLFLLLCAFSTGVAFAGFAGRDPRYPGFAERNFGLPFKAMFIGAHPDDADYQFGATATKLVKAGARVMFVSVCNGDNGHQTMDPRALAARRYAETQAAAKVYGVEKYVVMGEHDCLVEPTVDLRKRVTRLIREFAPHMVVTHRTCDYHADHRATGQVVQDATYLMGVPLFCPETPVPETLPFVMYAGDRFTSPRPFRPDLLVEGDDVLENTLRALACHESQLFEWLPPEYGIDPKTIPAGAEERIRFLAQHVPDDLHLNVNLNRGIVNRTFPGRDLRYVDAFELCEYARLPCQKEIDYLTSLGFRWTSASRGWNATADTVLLSNAHGRAYVSLTGANVLSYVPADGQDVFFRAAGFSVEDVAFAHGGMPIAWPWFGRKDGSNDGELIHGYARRLRWRVRERTDDRVVMVAESGDSTRRFDGRDFRLTYEVGLGESLDVALTMENTGREDLPISAGLHPFFRVSDNTKLRLEGVCGLSDIPAGIDKSFPFADGTCELVDKGLRRRIVLTTSGGNGLCVWNDAAQWPDIYAPGGATEFCCVEPILVGREDGRVGHRLAPGDLVRLTLSVRVKGE